MVELQIDSNVHILTHTTSGEMQVTSHPILVILRLTAQLEIVRFLLQPPTAPCPPSN
jgi:hypothetical protein